MMRAFVTTQTLLISLSNAGNDEQWQAKAPNQANTLEVPDVEFDRFKNLCLLVYGRFDCMLR